MKRKAVVKEIVEALLLEVNPENAENLPAGQWAGAIFGALGGVGIGYGCRVWTQGNPDYAAGGGWLYDQTWTRPESDDWAGRWSIPMVAECEWGNPDDIREDFEKLLQARADLRVMIIDTVAWNYDADAALGQLCDWARLFRGSGHNDLFLVVMYVYDRAAQAWNWRFFTIRNRRFGLPARTRDVTP